MIDDDASPAQPATTDKAAERLHGAAIHLLRRLRREDNASGLTAPRLSALSVVVFAGPDEKQDKVVHFEHEVLGIIGRRHALDKRAKRLHVRVECADYARRQQKIGHLSGRRGPGAPPMPRQQSTNIFGDSSSHKKIGSVV